MSGAILGLMRLPSSRWSINPLRRSSKFTRSMDEQVTYVKAVEKRCLIKVIGPIAQLLYLHELIPPF